MTVILTVLLGDSVFQASDRLVTIRGQNGIIEHDTSANKSIIFIGVDCRLSLGYTGPAYIGDVPTDAWIASLISGVGFENHAIMTFREGKPWRDPLDADSLVKLLTDHVPPAISVYIGGYKKVGQVEEPFIWRTGGGTAESAPTDRLTRPFLIAASPDWVTTEDLRYIAETVRLDAPQEWDSILVNCVRRISTRSPSVGGDVMLVEVSETQRWLGASLHLQASSAEGHDAVPALYSPALVSAASVLAPMRLSANGQRFVLHRGQMSFGGDLRDPLNDCIVHFNFGQPFGGASSFNEHERAAPPGLW